MIFPLQLFIIIFLAISSSYAGTIYDHQGDIFDHVLHAKKLKIACSTCHGQKMRDKKMGRKFKKQNCHSCHVNGKQLAKAPMKCTMCHGSSIKKIRAGLSKIRPSHHNVPNFKTGHGTLATHKKKDCLKCHKEKSCSECHNRFRTKRNPHPAHFLMTHGMQAKLGSMRCDSCHRKDTCTDCHRKRK